MSKFYKNYQGKLVNVPDDVDVNVISNGTTLLELKANSTDGAGEKHVPKVSYDKDKNVVVVEVGEVLHPMLDEHFINEITLDTDKGTYTKRLKPGTEPVVAFVVDEDETPVTVYEYCNLHGLWKKDL